MSTYVLYAIIKNKLNICLKTECRENVRDKIITRQKSCVIQWTLNVTCSNTFTCIKSHMTRQFMISLGKFSGTEVMSLQIHKDVLPQFSVALRSFMQIIAHVPWYQLFLNLLLGTKVSVRFDTALQPCLRYLRRMFQEADTEATTWLITSFPAKAHQ